MFEKASRMKLRFETAKGCLSVEDLWDLPLTSANGPSLDGVAIALDKKLKDTTNVSFVNKDPKTDQTTQLKFNIVCRIIEVRLAEQEAAARSKEIADERQKLLKLLDEKKDEALRAMTPEEIQKKLESLK